MSGAVGDAITAATPAPVVHPNGAKFLGAMSCSSSLCHGGGSAGDRGAYTVWKAKDPHRQSFAVLAGTQAARIAQGLQLASAAASTRCTECHAPLATVAEERLAHGLDARTEGVSCESCHGPSANWIRSHTRHDFTHAQNVQTGVRDLRDLYARANTCVACHQVIAPDVLAAGHPPLIFELDAQTVAEPRHWIDQGDFFGPQAWLTGQAAALRETSWSLSQQADPRPEVREQWRALVWLLQKTTSAYGHGVPTFDAPDADTFSPGNVARAQSLADDLARAASRSEWTGASTRQMLEALAATDKDFVPVARAGNRRWRCRTARNGSRWRSRGWWPRSRRGTRRSGWARRRSWTSCSRWRMRGRTSTARRSPASCSISARRWGVGTDLPCGNASHQKSGASKSSATSQAPACKSA